MLILHPTLPVRTPCWPLPARVGAHRYHHPRIPRSATRPFASPRPRARRPQRDAGLTRPGARRNVFETVVPRETAPPKAHSSNASVPRPPSRRTKDDAPARRLSHARQRVLRHAAAPRPALRGLLMRTPGLAQSVRQAIRLHVQPLALALTHADCGRARATPASHHGARRHQRLVHRRVRRPTALRMRCHVHTRIRRSHAREHARAQAHQLETTYARATHRTPRSASVRTILRPARMRSGSSRTPECAPQNHAPARFT